MILSEGIAYPVGSNVNEYSVELCVYENGKEIMVIDTIDGIGNYKGTFKDFNIDN